MPGMQSVEEDSGDEGGSRRRKRRSSNAGVHYSEDLSDAMFNRLMQTDDASESASEVFPRVLVCLHVALHPPTKLTVLRNLHNTMCEVPHAYKS